MAETRISSLHDNTVLFILPATEPSILARVLRWKWTQLAHTYIACVILDFVLCLNPLLINRS